MKNMIKQTYYQYKPGEFLPVYSAGVLLNKRQFHSYRLKQMIADPAGAFYAFTHYAN